MTGSVGAPKRGYSKGPPGRKWTPHTTETSRWGNYKVCQVCGERKRMTEFRLAGAWRKKKAADPKRYSGHCKVCTRAGNARRIDPNFVFQKINRIYPPERTPEQKRADNAKYKKRVRRKTRIKALEYLASKGCCECGERDPRVLEFDHIEPQDKIDNVSRILTDGHSWGTEKLRAEIRKCRVICANCHRLHTTTQQEYYAHDDVRTALRQIYADYDITE